MEACCSGLEMVAKRIVEYGGDLNCQPTNFGSTALMYACRRRLEGLVDYLIENGADVNLQSRNGKTALMEACRSGDLGCVKKCYLGGAQTGLSNRDGDDSMDIAVMYNHNNIADFLEFVHKSEVAKLILIEMKLPRKILVLFYDNGLTTTEACRSYVSHATDADYEKLGVDKTGVRMKFKAWSSINA